MLIQIKALVMRVQAGKVLYCRSNATNKFVKLSIAQCVYDFEQARLALQIENADAVKTDRITCSVILALAIIINVIAVGFMFYC